MGRWVEKKVEDLPPSSVEALNTALQIEGEPQLWFDDMAWIMAQESEGKVDARNSSSSARGLYQLTRVNYPLNPNGEASFGNAVDECRGGIRYVRQRYHTAKAAREFWQNHHHY
jgi:SLT domain-containing protein